MGKSRAEETFEREGLVISKELRKRMTPFILKQREE